MQANARVERVESGRVWLKVSDEGQGCGRCDQPGGCRSMRITDAFGLPSRVFSLPSELPLSPGDQVVIQIADGAPLRAALASYGVAAVLLIVGAMLGKSIAPATSADAWAAVGAAAGLGLAVLAHRVLTRSRNWRAQLQLKLSAEPVCTHFSRDS